MTRKPTRWLRDVGSPAARQNPEVENEGRPSLQAALESCRDVAPGEEQEQGERQARDTDHDFGLIGSPPERAKPQQTNRRRQIKLAAHEPEKHAIAVHAGPNPCVGNVDRERCTLVFHGLTREKAHPSFAHPAQFKRG